MKGHGVAAVGRSLPLRGFADDGDLVIAVARLVADHGTGASHPEGPLPTDPIHLVA
jgi:hypothetical protein